MHFLGKSKHLIPVYKNMPQQSLSESVNLLLSPQFYTLKKEQLPLKYAFQAKKIATSLFDGLLENAHTYEYLVYKEADNWVFIAYDLEEINHFLLSKGFKPEQIGKIFFAQEAQRFFTAPVLLGEKDALVSINDSITLVPQAALTKDSETVTCDDSFTPKGGVALHGAFNSFIARKEALTLATLFTIFAFAFFAEGWRYGNNTEETFSQIEALLEEYPALQSEYTRKSIAKKYRAIDKNERAKRDLIKTFGSMIFKGVKVERFKMNDKGFSVQYICSSDSVLKRLSSVAKREGFENIKTLKGNILQIEVGL